jgi:hypothetical protein
VYQGGNEFDVSFRFRVDGDMVDFFDIEVDGQEATVEDETWLEAMRTAAYDRAAQIRW